MFSPWQAEVSLHSACPGSATANGRVPSSCFGRVFYFKLGSFSVKRDVYGKLKTQARFCPTSSSLSIAHT